MMHEVVKMKTQLLRRLQVDICVKISLLFLLGLVAGCTTGGTIALKPVVEPPGITEKQLVTRLEDGRRGFVLTEIFSGEATTLQDFEQAVDLLHSGDFTAAIVLLEKVIKASPGVTAPHINIAMAYRKVGKPEQAEEQLKIALNLIPGHPVASNEYGLLLRAAGRFAEARDVYGQAIKRFPEYLPAHRNLGILCDLYLSDQECALAQYKYYSAAKPDAEQVKVWISELQLRTGH